MKFTCEKALLQSAISISSRAVSPKSSITALEGILVNATDELRLTGYNLSTGIRTIVPADVTEPGTLVLSAHLFGDIIRRLADDVVSVSTENNMVNIKCGMSEFNLIGASPAEFPELPNVEKNQGIKLSCKLLRSMIDHTVFAVSDNENKPIHTGSLFEITGNQLTVVSVDGYRLAILKRPFKAEKDIRIIIPSKTLTEVNKLIGDEDEEVQINANRQFVVFSTAKGYTILSRLIVGEFLNYEKALPAGCKTSALIDTREFIDCIERASLVITERLKDPLRIRFEDGKVTVNCKTSLGKVEDEFPAVVEGEPQEIGFNNRYLLDALRASGCAQVRMEMNGPLSPVKILPPDGEDFIYLVLPIRFKNE